MAAPGNGEKLKQFMDTGIYRLESSNAVFFDPVRMLNRSYSCSKVAPSVYYSRFFESKSSEETRTGVPVSARKRKRKEKPPPVPLNDRERAADCRHQEVRPFLLKALDSLLGADELLSVMPDLRNAERASVVKVGSPPLPQQSLIELGRVWQASMCEITLSFPRAWGQLCDEGSQRVLPVFENLVVNETEDDVEAEFLGSRYIIPRESSFYMSDLKHIKNLVPDDPASGFHLIVVDPPWENGSAQQKLRYPTLPNRYFMSIPIKQLAHEEGALVALWVTNREKLRIFVENELFPTWGVKHVATFHWLKVKADGSLICDLDLFHHRPYESLLLGYCNMETMDSDKLSKGGNISDNQVMISVPGDYSRKPPIEDLVAELTPGIKPPRRIELFAREMKAGWLSWGNEPLYFQESRYFLPNCG